MLISELKVSFGKPLKKHIGKYYGDTGLDEHILNKKLKKLGWRAVGAGSFSTVYENATSPYLLKVNKYPDVGYSTFAKIAQAHPNKHFPKIGKIKKYEYDDDTYYIYLIEKLKEIPGSSGSDIAQALSKVLWFPIGTPLARIFNKKTPKIFTKQPGLIQALNILNKATGIGDGRDSDVSLDLHGENVMQRKDGTIVIIDPFM